MTVCKIEVNFPIPLELETEDFMAIDRVIAGICNKRAPEGYVIWPARQGSKTTYMAITAEEEADRHRAGLPSVEYDDSIFAIECAIKEKK